MVTARCTKTEKKMLNIILVFLDGIVYSNCLNAIVNY